MSLDPYHTLAFFYDRLFEPLNAGLHAVGLSLCPAQPGLRVLDVGCGTGALTRRYVEGGCEVLGLDGSPAMLARARAKLGGRATLLRGGVDRLPLGDASVDLVTFSMVLHELAPGIRSAAVGEAARVLRPGGRVLAVDFHPGPLRLPRGHWQRGLAILVERAAGREHFAGFRHFLASGGLPALATEQGLRVAARRVLGGGTFAVCALEPLPS